MFAFIWLEIRASSKIREKSHLTGQLNSLRVREYTNVSRLVPVQVKMLKKSSLALEKNFMPRSLKRQKYCCRTSQNHLQEELSTIPIKAAYRGRREDVASEAAWGSLNNCDGWCIYFWSEADWKVQLISEETSNFKFRLWKNSARTME